MNGKISPKESNLKDYTIYTIIIMSLFIIGGYFILNLINSTLLEHMKQDSNKNASTHIARLANSTYADNVINDLLEDRIIATCKLVLENEENLSNEFLKSLAENLKIDYIYWFNSKGQILYSANDYLGWQMDVDNTIYEFMQSDLQVLVEPIRPDEPSGEYRKYGEMKSKDGSIVQVGISADIIQEMTRRFCPQVFVNELSKHEGIVDAYYLSHNNNFLLCNDDAPSKGLELGSQELLAIGNNEIYYDKKDYNGTAVYEALYPIYIENEKMGTLIIIYSLDNINTLIKQVSTIAIILLILLFIAYGIMAISTNRKNKAIRELAYYDPVTKTFNKNYFIRYMENELKNDSKNKRAILVLNFKNIGLFKLNYGQVALNKLLKDQMDKIKILDKIEGNIFTYNEESFCIYINQYNMKDELIEFCKLLISNLNRMEKGLENEEIISPRIAILELEEDYNKIDLLLKDLDMIIERIDEIKEDGYLFFDENYRQEILFDEKIDQALLKAHYMGYEEFYLLYQPQLDLATNKIVGIEALARWKSRELGSISPIKFIKIAEESRSINNLGKWIINTSCQFLKELELQGIVDIKMAINISVVQLLEENFVEEVLSIIKDTKINPNLLKLEITETNLMDNYKIANKKLKLLKEKGINISLDDFGTGHSSLSRLKNLNIDYLKIDKSFVDHVISMDEDILINSILSIAKELKLKVIAEGVEEEVQRDYLRSRGCDIMQGYLFSRPISEQDVIELIKNVNEGD